MLNQVLVRFHRTAAPRADDTAEADELTRLVVERVQQEGTCWLGGTVWHGVAAMRVSVSNWSTTEADVRRSVDAILTALAHERPFTGH